MKSKLKTPTDSTRCRNTNGLQMAKFYVDSFLSHIREREVVCIREGKKSRDIQDLYTNTTKIDQEHLLSCS